LDTCALLWLANADTLANDAVAALAEAEGIAGGIAVSPISAWEIGQLAARGRITLPMEPLAWFQTAVDSGIALSAMPPSVLVGSSFLPGKALRDPADRIIAATARMFGYRLMTRDRPLLDLSRDGHLQAIAC
jgi:PIN domain nuclease of toxin-antitoxin system